MSSISENLKYEKNHYTRVLTKQFLLGIEYFGKIGGTRNSAIPASIKSDFDKAFLYVADVNESAKITEGQEEVTFKVNIPAGKYDLEAKLIDKDKRNYPVYYLYIEKL